MTDALAIHIHVPKCAGTTLERHFKRELGPDGFWLPPKRTRNFPLELFGRKYDSALTQSAEQVRAISGHYIGRSVESLFPGRRIIRSITLRDPERLMLSYYNFRSMRYLSQGLNAYSFSLFLRSMRINPVTHFLLERWFELPWARMARMRDEEKAALLDKMLGALDYVVDISETDSLIATLSRELRIAEQAPRANISADRQQDTGWKMLHLEDVSEKDRLLLKSRVRLDRYLWRRWVLKENIEFNASSRSGFLLSEFVRPAYQVQRRAIRRHGASF